MPSQSKFLRNALRIIKEKPSGFKALEEFEKTGKTITKTRLNFTIDRTLAKEFRDYCKKHRINMSELVESLIKKNLKAS
ncbi:hypothetical protein HYT56_04530 [Candidatus Woesearchaeota archaeon]|nr:hypothetical protein [Candidatus Woesearchaeota archaeon]